MKRPAIARTSIFLLGVALLLSNTALLFLPAEAGTCRVTCPNGEECVCIGSTCSARDGWGCSGSGISHCRCGTKPMF